MQRSTFRSSDMPADLYCQIAPSRRLLIELPGLAASSRRTRGRALERPVRRDARERVEMPRVQRAPPGADFLVAAELAARALGEGGDAHARPVVLDEVHVPIGRPHGDPPSAPRAPGGKPPR